MKKISFLLCLLYLQSSVLHAVTADELMQVHKVTTTEMNSITTPRAGSLIYNTTENTLFFYTGTVWKRLRANGSETIIHAGKNMTVIGNGTNSSTYVIGK